MDCRTPGFPVLQYLPVCSNLCSPSQWCHPIISSSIMPFSSCPQSFPASGSYAVCLFASGGQSIWASTSAAIFLMNIQGWFPLGLTGLVSSLSKGISRIFSSATVWKHQFFCAQLSLRSNSHICTWILVKKKKKKAWPKRHLSEGWSLLLFKYIVYVCYIFSSKEQA